MQLHQVMVGTGNRLFPVEGSDFPLALKTCTALGNGVVRLTCSQV
ncbi:hypothetical protein [Amycolatopsis thailandensis]|nr:hypothetical protein [Amycolatopsis thailandensis]